MSQVFLVREPQINPKCWPLLEIQTTLYMWILQDLENHEPIAVYSSLVLNWPSPWNTSHPKKYFWSSQFSQFYCKEATLFRLKILTRKRDSSSLIPIQQDKSWRCFCCECGAWKTFWAPFLIWPTHRHSGASW